MGRFVLSGQEEKMVHEVLSKLLKEYMHEELGCCTIGQRLEGRGRGTPDFLGIKDRRGVSDNRVEAVTVNFEGEKESVQAALGEVLGYSFFAHRCYLAVFGSSRNDPLSPEELELARKLGVGVIEVSGGEGRCREVVVSDYHEPLRPLGFKNLGALESYSCSVCGRRIFRLDRDRRFEFEEAGGPGASKSKKEESHLWICPSCLKSEVSQK